MVAEMGKFVDNSWHAVKVAFANEIGRIATAASTPRPWPKSSWPTPSSTFHPTICGPAAHMAAPACPRTCRACWPWRAIPAWPCRCWPGRATATRLHLAWLAQAVRAKLAPPGPILLLGLSFKAGTDDLRNSPLLDLAEILVEGGYDLAIYDPDVDPARLVGVNFAVAAEHQATLMDRMTQDLEAPPPRQPADRLGQADPGRARAPAAGVPVLDVPRLQDIGRAARPWHDRR